MSNKTGRKKTEDKQKFVISSLFNQALIMDGTVIGTKLQGCTFRMILKPKDPRMKLKKIRTISGTHGFGPQVSLYAICISHTKLNQKPSIIRRDGYKNLPQSIKDRGIYTTDGNGNVFFSINPTQGIDNDIINVQNLYHGKSKVKGGKKAYVTLKDLGSEHVKKSRTDYLTFVAGGGLNPHKGRSKDEQKIYAGLPKTGEQWDRIMERKLRGMNNEEVTIVDKFVKRQQKTHNTTQMLARSQSGSFFDIVAMMSGQLQQTASDVVKGFMEFKVSDMQKTARVIKDYKKKQGQGRYLKFQLFMVHPYKSSKAFEYEERLLHIELQLEYGL